MLPALAFLPPFEVPNAFREVAEELNNEVDLLDYFESTYIGRDVAGRFRPARLVFSDGY